MKILLLATSILSITAFQPIAVPRLRSASCRGSHLVVPKISTARPSRQSALYMSEKVESTGGGTASIPNEIFNLVKSIVGAGVLSLPAGTWVCICALLLLDGSCSVHLQNIIF